MLLINPVTALLQSPLCVVYQVSPLQREQGHTRSIRCDRKNVRTSGVFWILFFSIIFMLMSWVARFAFLPLSLNWLIWQTFCSRVHLDLQGQRINVLLLHSRYAFLKFMTK
jgi:hypothetical protein